MRAGWEAGAPGGPWPPGPRALVTAVCRTYNLYSVDSAQQALKDSSWVAGVRLKAAAIHQRFVILQEELLTLLERVRASWGGQPHDSKSYLLRVVHGTIRHFHHQALLAAADVCVCNAAAGIMSSTTRTSVLLVLLIAAASAGLQQAGASAKPASVDAAHMKWRTSCKKMKEATRSAVNKVIWPTSMKIALSGVPPPEFSAKVNGRIAPVGTFQVSATPAGLVCNGQQ